VTDRRTSSLANHQPMSGPRRIATTTCGHSRAQFAVGGDIKAQRQGQAFAALVEKMTERRALPVRLSVEIEPARESSGLLLLRGRGSGQTRCAKCRSLAASRTGQFDRFCSLMGQGSSGFRRLGMPVFSARSPALDGVSWVQGGLVQDAVGRGLAACNRIGPSSAPSLGRRSFWELDSASCFVGSQ
jgi:hypothetical protein